MAGLAAFDRAGPFCAQPNSVAASSKPRTKSVKLETRNSVLPINYEKPAATPPKRLITYRRAPPVELADLAICLSFSRSICDGQTDKAPI